MSQASAVSAGNPRSDTGLPGLVSVISPGMRMIVWYAWRKGIERQLIEHYCR